jgi:sulfate adenylyltransferase subunit 1
MSAPTLSPTHTATIATTLLRFSTAGSVDDGKSTLIGRLLLDTGNVARDQLEALEQSSRKRGHGYVDLALLTDGLKAERDQGITIDVAYRYFTTPRRKFILADTPGHEEYTRNMVTGASNAQVSLILVDARQGILPQTARHYGIASLLGHRHVVFCINKMDLVDWDAQRYHELVAQLEAKALTFAAPGQTRHYIPIAALHGDNVVNPSAHTPWYTGQPLLALLEGLDAEAPAESLPARFPVQWVIRPQSAEYADYRGYAGRVSSGQLRVGDRLRVLPSGQESTLTAIYSYTEQLSVAPAGRSVTLLLADDVDISRGDTLVPVAQAPEPTRTFSARLCWMDKKPLQPGTMLLLQHGSQRVKAKVQALPERLNIELLAYEAHQGPAQMNDIVTAQLHTASPLALDAFVDNPAGGSFILIDDSTRNTVAAGMVHQLG